MLGYCPVEKPGGSYHGTAYNILTQTFQTSGTPPDTSACSANQYNTITSDNNVMPSDYNMVKGNGLNVGPFASVFDPGSQLAGSTVYNMTNNQGTAICNRASNQCEYFNNPGVNNYCPYSSGSGNTHRSVIFIMVLRVVIMEIVTHAPCVNLLLAFPITHYRRTVKVQM